MTDVHYTFDVPKGRQRFRELIVYVSARSVDDPHFGAVKLNKILFYSEMTAFQRHGEPLTGMAYFRLEKGPAPRAMMAVQRDLIEEGAISIEERPITGNHTQKRTIAHREADIDLFSKSELRIVDDIISQFEGMTADAASIKSHKIAWHALQDRDLIPYEAAFLSDDLPTAHDISEARRLNSEHGWGLRV